MRSILAISLASLGGAELAAKTAATTLEGHTGLVWSIAFSPDGKYLASASIDQTARIWDVGSSAQVHVLSGHSDGLRSVAFSPDGKLATGSSDKSVKVWDVSTGKMLHSMGPLTDGVRAVAYSPDGETVAAATGDGLVTILDSTNGTQRQTLSGHTGDIFNMAFSPDGQRLATASSDRLVKVWDIGTGKEAYDIKPQSYAVMGVAFSPNERLIATSGGTAETGKLSTYDAATGEHLGTRDAHRNGIFSIEFSPDSQLIATAGHADMTGKLINTHSGSDVAILEGHELAVMDVAFSPDGKTVATAAADKRIRLWSVDDSIREFQEKDQTASEPPASTPIAPMVQPPVELAQSAASALSTVQSPPSKEITANSAGEKMLTWIQSNNRFGPSSKLVSDMAELIDSEITKGQSTFALTFGPDLLKEQVPYQLHVFAGEFFRTRLSSDQAKALGLEGGSLQHSSGPASALQYRGETVAKLGAPQFANGNALAGTDRLKGTVHCQVLAPTNEKLAVRLSYYTSGNRMGFHYLDALPAEQGDLSFDFSELTDGDYKGPLVLFMDLCTVSENSGKINVTLFSDTVATLVDVR